MSVYNTVLTSFCGRTRRSGGTAADYGPGVMDKSSALTVTLKPKVSAEPLAVEDPSAGGWAGYSQQIRYAIAPTRAYHDASPAQGCT